MKYNRAIVSPDHNIKININLLDKLKTIHAPASELQYVRCYLDCGECLTFLQIVDHSIKKFINTASEQ